MDANIYDFVKESAATTGSGLTITLSAIDGFARFSDVATVGESVYYAISNGANRELGIGTVQTGNTLDRTTPLVTLVAGVYDNINPIKITLVGTSTVAIAPSAMSLLDLLDDTARLATTGNLSVGFTTDTETLASDTIAPDMTAECVKTRAMAGNLTINMPTGGNGICHIILTVGSTDRTVTLGTNVNSTGGVPTLTASTVWVATVIRVSATYAVVRFSQVD